MNADPIKELEEQIKKLRAKRTYFETEEDYKKYINYNIGLEELSFIAYRYYGSHEYSDFLLNNFDYIEKLTYEDKFDLFKELYCNAKDCSFIGDLIQGFVKYNKIPNKEIENIKANFKPVAYRGYNETNLEDGCSYTLDFETAKWFSQRFRVLDKNGYVIKIDLEIDDIIFYNDHESEVFIKKDRLNKKNKEIIKIEEE